MLKIHSCYSWQNFEKKKKKDAPTYSLEHFTMLSERKVIDSIVAYDNIQTKIKPVR